ncbi:MAG TPA: lysylphosphatidylglycerol synthase transmembrane domain-containing protein [Acidimicrobiales bacterium]
MQQSRSDVIAVVRHELNLPVFLPSTCKRTRCTRAPKTSRFAPYIERIATEAQPRSRTHPVRRVIAVVVAGLSLYVLMPALVNVVSSWPRLLTLGPWWLVIAFFAEAASFVCQMALLRLVLRTKNWFAVVTAFLAGNSVTNTLPGGDAVGASVQYRMLAGTGIDTVQAAGGLAVSSIIGVGALFALPIFALPIIVGGETVSAGLVHAGELGAVGFALIVALGVLVLKSDRTLLTLAKIINWVFSKIPGYKGHRQNADDLGQRLINERNQVRVDLGKNWWKAILLVAGRIGFDYGSLLAILRATGTRPNPSLVLLAYAATAVLALLPITPGGLGLVEASLSGLLVLADVPSANAVVATLAFRLGSYWLPTIAGGVCYWLYRRRYGPLRQNANAA